MSYAIVDMPCQLNEDMKLCALGDVAGSWLATAET